MSRTAGVGATVSGDAEARRGARLRGGVALAAMLAAGALLAGCGTAAPGAAADPEREPAPQAGPAVEGAAGDASGALAETNGQVQDDRQGGDSSEDSAVALPASWDGTYSAESLPDGSGYLVIQNLYGEQRGATVMEASEVEGIEFFGGTGTSCEGTATLAGDTVDCIMPEDGQGDGATTAVVHLVPSAFGATSLFIEVGVTDGLDIAQAPQGIGALAAEEPGAITREDAEGAVLTAVMMADSPEGPLPEGLEVRCDLLDGGVHMLCDVTGTPDGGGDGSWYGTVQPGYRWDVVLATQLPE